VPSKTLRESALYFSGLRQRGLYGIDYSLREGLTVADFMHHKDAVVSAERAKIAANLAAHKIELIAGTARFEDAHTISAIEEHGAPRLLRGEVILIATGSKPHRPLQTFGYITNRPTASDPSRDVLSLRQCEREERAPTGGRNNPSVLRQQKVNRHMALAKGSPNLMQRLPRLPTAPHVGLLRCGKPHPSAFRHKHHL
jgi:hypothetical protein